MDVFQTLTILTFITSTVTMICVIVAVLPHVKQGMVFLRDALLWAAFVLVVAFAGWLGWQRVSERFVRPTGRIGDPAAASASPAPTAVVTRSTTADPFYQGPMTD
jgi:ABC-type nickel/cobalt efflux system permease component RcnA